METQECTTTSSNVESLRSTFEYLLCINKGLHMKRKNLTTDREALHKGLNNLRGQDSSVPETYDAEEEQTTCPEDCSSLCKANAGLSHKNKALSSEIESLSEDIEGLQKEMNYVTSQKLSASTSEATATQIREKFLLHRAFWVEMEDNEKNLERCGEKLKVLKTGMESQTAELSQEIVEANGVLSQENEAWQMEKAKLLEEIAVPKCEAEAKVNSRAWDEEREVLHPEIAMLTDQKEETDAEQDRERLRREVYTITQEKRELEKKLTEAEQVNEALRHEVKELQALLQKEKEMSNINEVRIKVHTRMDELREELEEAQIVSSFDQLLIEQLREEISLLRDLVRENSNNTTLSSNQDLGSEPNVLSMRTRFMRIFRPGWKRRYSSRETEAYVEPGEPVQEERRRRKTLRQRFVNTYNRLIRRT